jgi:hypothetical protein
LEVEVVKTAAAVAHMTIRGTGALLILLGVTFWTGNALQLIPVHIFLGIVLVLSLWMLAAIAGASGVQMRWVILAVAWGLILPVLGLTQDRLLAGGWHWTIQVLHLLIGLGAMGQGEGLAMRMRRAGSVPVRAA